MKDFWEEFNTWGSCTSNIRGYTRNSGVAIRKGKDDVTTTICTQNFRNFVETVTLNQTFLNLHDTLFVYLDKFNNVIPMYRCAGTLPFASSHIHMKNPCTSLD